MPFSTMEEDNILEDHDCPPVAQSLFVSGYLAQRVAPCPVPTGRISL